MFPRPTPTSLIHSQLPPRVGAEWIAAGRTAIPEYRGARHHRLFGHDDERFDHGAVAESIALATQPVRFACTTHRCGPLRSSHRAGRSEAPAGGIGLRITCRLLPRAAPGAFSVPAGVMAHLPVPLETLVLAGEQPHSMTRVIADDDTPRSELVAASPRCMAE